MKTILALTLSVFVCSAIGASAQTNSQGGTNKQGGSNQNRSTPSKSKPMHYTGCVGGSAANGYTLATAGKSASAPPVVYSLIAADGTKINLVALPGQKVEVTGALVPVKPTDKDKPRVVEVTEVKVVPGGC
jgi:hypothetical protein